MNKLKNTLPRLLLLMLVLVLGIGQVASAGEIAWREVYSQNFDSIADGILPEDAYTEEKGALSAEYKDGSVQIKSNNMTYISYEDISSIAAANKMPYANGITQSGSYFSGKFQTPLEYMGATFYYEGSSDSNVIYSEIDGKKAFTQVTTIAAPNKEGNRTSIRNPHPRYVVDAERFKSTDNNLRFTMEYYVTDSKLYKNDDKKRISFNYRNKANGLSTKSLNISDITPNQWNTLTFDVNDADLSGLFQQGNEKWSMKVSGPSYYNTIPTEGVDAAWWAAQGIDTEFFFYIHSILVEKLGGETAADFTKPNKAVALPLAEGDLYGNSKLSFDMMLPESELLNSDTSFNTGSNAMTVSLADVNKNDVATFEFEVNGRDEKIYSVSTNNEGNRVKTLLYTGNILDRSLHYTYTLNDKAKTYTVAIKSGEEDLVLETVPMPINNLALISGSCLGRFLTVKHANNSKALMNVIDNVKMEIQDDPEFLNVKADIDAIDLGLKEGATENFTLPVVGSINSAAITWTSDNAVIAIDGANASVTRGEEDVDVILTAQGLLNGISYRKEFPVKVLEHPDHINAKEDVAAIVIDIPESFRVRDNFTLPETVDGSAISWSSSNLSVLAINGYGVDVTRSAEDTFATLTASVTVGDFTVTRDFDITVAALSNVFAEVGDVKETVAAGKVSATLKVKYPGKAGNFSFIAYVVDHVTGDVSDAKADTKTVLEGDIYKTLDFSVADLSKTASDEVMYYFWSDNQVSMVNCAPADIDDLKATGKVLGVALDWTPTADDNNAIEYYDIFRDGEHIGQSFTNYYIDKTAEKDTEYAYNVVPYDTNTLSSISGEVSGETIPMHYIDYNKLGMGDTDYTVGFNHKEPSTDPNRDAYCFITEVEDKNGDKCYAISTTNKYVHITSDKTCVNAVTRDTRSVVLEITYLDTTGKLTLQYNSEIPEGEKDSLAYARKPLVIADSMGNTREWKTVVVKINDAELRETTDWFSGRDMGFVNSIPNTIFIKKIRMIPGHLYE